MRIKAKYLSLICALSTATICLFFSPFDDLTAEEPLQTARFVKIIRAIDGDTIEIEGGERVRYIGIDTPELHHPNKPVQPFAEEAWRYNQSLVEGKMVYLVQDIQPRDRYKRILAYVFVDDVLINARLVKDGYARVATYPPNVIYEKLFLRLERKARKEKGGLWNIPE